jgi:hypothetical protein
MHSIPTPFQRDQRRRNQKMLLQHNYQTGEDTLSTSAADYATSNRQMEREKPDFRIQIAKSSQQ